MTSDGIFPSAKTSGEGSRMGWVSMRGRTGIRIFEGIMDASVCVDILDRTLEPFLREVYPDGHCFIQDSDPKHTSRLDKHFLEDNYITWWKTPPESPDLNPIENMWHELKEFLRRELNQGLKMNWSVAYSNSGVQCLARNAKST